MLYEYLKETYGENEPIFVADIVSIAETMPGSYAESGDLHQLMGEYEFSAANAKAVLVKK